MNDMVIVYMVSALMGCYVIYRMGVRSGIKKLKESLLVTLAEMKAAKEKLEVDKEAILLVSKEIYNAKNKLAEWHNALVGLQANLDRQDVLLVEREANLSERLGNIKVIKS